MSELSVTLTVVGIDDGLNRVINKTLQYSEFAYQRINVPPAATAMDLAPFIAQLGSDESCKFLAAISDRDGVVLNLTTATGEEAEVPCYPFAVMGKELGFDIGTPFALTIDGAGGDETAHVLLIAVGGNPS